LVVLPSTDTNNKTTGAGKLHNNYTTDMVLEPHSPIDNNYASMNMNIQENPLFSNNTNPLERRSKSTLIIFIYK